MQAFDLKPLVAECCSDVLESMYFTTVLECSSQVGIEPALQADELAFSLSFQGDLQGTFGLGLERSDARMLAANFLGEPEESLTETEIAEVVGELANMLCGVIVSRIEGSSKFALSHPEPCTTPSAGRDILTSQLTTDNGTLLTWIALDPSLETPHPSLTETPQAAH